MSRWQVRHTVMTDTPHVVPLEDLREHDPDRACWCKPVLDEGVIVHNAMDGREAFETGERKPS